MSRRGGRGSVGPVSTSGEASGAGAADVFARVVCGVDGSPEGVEAVRQARRLSRRESRLTLVSVSETHLAVHAGMLAAEWAERLDRDAQAALDEAAAVAEGGRTLRVHGRAAEALLQALDREAATLVAVGSHQISRGAGMLIGSVATRLVHEAPCSVLIARAAEDGGGWPRSIVVGLDGSPGSLSAAAVARELGERLPASVGFVVGRGADPGDLAADSLASCEYELSFSDAKPVPALLYAARDADLLVVGSRGLTGIRALGSVSERVAHQARCSLLVVRQPPAP